MDNSNFNNSPTTIDIVGGAIEVTSHLDSRSLISSLWRNLCTSNLAQDGDRLTDRSHNLLQRHLRLMTLLDQVTVRDSLNLSRERRDNMENQNGVSQLRKNLAARDYKRQAKKTYKLVKVASARALENFLRSQIDNAQGRPPPPGGGLGSPTLGDGLRGSFGTGGTAASHPFGDSHAVSSITDINVDEADQGDMTASRYQDEATHEEAQEAAIYDILNRDRTLKDVLAFTGDRTDRGASQSTASAPVPTSSQQEDDSRPLFVSASMLEVLDQSVDEQGETCTLESFAMSEVVTWEGKRPHPVMRASVPPVDGDPYTCSTAPRRRL